MQLHRHWKVQRAGPKHRGVTDALSQGPHRCIPYPVLWVSKGAMDVLRMKPPIIVSILPPVTSILGRITVTSLASSIVSGQQEALVTPVFVFTVGQRTHSLSTTSSRTGKTGFLHQAMLSRLQLTAVPMIFSQTQ